jgi:hypothetical protein
MNARRYFRRSGALLIVVSILMALLGALAAPDNLGRAIAGVLALSALGAAVWRFRKAAAVSPTAIARESVVPGARRVSVVIEEVTMVKAATWNRAPATASRFRPRARTVMFPTCRARKRLSFSAHRDRSAPR